MKKLLLSLACFLIAAPPLVACEMHMVATPLADAVRLTWDAVPGMATPLYFVFEKNADFAGDWRFVTSVVKPAGQASSVKIEPGSSVRTEYQYMVVARDQTNDQLSCSQIVEVNAPPSERLAEVSHRRIVPLVGKTRGQNGSDFRTSLTLHFYPLTKGRIYFRPVGTVASDADPSIAYEFGDNGSDVRDIYFEDLLAAMNATGLGSLELVPDPGTRPAIPEVDVRVYNVTPEGTFGSRVPAVWPGELLRSPEAEPRQVLWVPGVTENFRRNVGFRTLARTGYFVKTRPAGAEQWESSELKAAPANYTWFGSVEQLVGHPVPSDMTVLVEFINGLAIGFRTETENMTNDPTVVVSEPGDWRGEVSWRF